MIGELEGRVREQSHGIVSRDGRIKWHQERLSQLDGELSRAWEEVGEKQSRIEDLRGRVEQVRADKLRAIDEAKGSAQRLAQREEEVKKKELEIRTLQGELVSSRERSSELERRVAEADEQAVLLRSQVAETEMRLGMLRGEHDADCADAFRLGVEDVRTRISTARPEWDVSFLDAEAIEACTPGDEEDEYEDDSDVDSDVALGAGETTAPEGGPSQPVAEEAKAFEKGESSQTAQGVPKEATDIVLIPDP